MPFVNEKFPDSEKAKIENLIDARPKFSRPASSSWWTVDHARNLALVLVGKEGGSYEGTTLTCHYILSVNGNPVHLSADPQGVSETAQGVIMSWRIHKLEIPSELQNQRQQVLSLIQEAFSTLGNSYDGEQYVAVNLTFDLSEKN